MKRHKKLYAIYNAFVLLSHVCYIDVMLFYDQAVYVPNARQKGKDICRGLHLGTDFKA